jgi:predicted transcriptional regulator
LEENMTRTAFRNWRIDARIPQFDISNRSGVDRSKVSLYECGHVQLTDGEVAALEKALCALIEERAKYLTGVLSLVGPEPEKEVAV